MTELISEINCEIFDVPTSSKSSLERPFKLLVKNEVFTIDSEKFKKLSPIFAVMCFGRDFENGRELTREIVDEKSNDIAIFLKCLHNYNNINENNFSTIIRLAKKYQVNSLVEVCENFILEGNALDKLKADQVLTLLIAANDHHVSRKVIAEFILRLAKEDRLTFNRLKLSRYLPSNLYGAVIATNMNIIQLREIEQMNGHVFKLERSKIAYKRSMCDKCKKIIESCFCDGCRLTLCKDHWIKSSCISDYGIRMLKELKNNVVELDYNEQ